MTRLRRRYEPAPGGASPAPATGPARPGAAVPILVWLVTGLWCSLLLGASLIWPPGYGSDEPAHVDMAYHYSVHPLTFEGPGQLQLSRGVTAAVQTLPGIPPTKRLSTVAPVPRPDRPSLARLGGPAAVPGVSPNQMVQHPPLYYWAEALVMRFPGVSSLAWDLQVWLMRLLSIAFMVPLPVLCWAATRRLIAEPFGPAPPELAGRLATLAAVLPVGVPNLVRDGASVDNDSLLILSSTVVLYLCSRVLTGDVRMRTAGLLGGVLAVAMWTKGLALALPLVVLLAYAMAATRDGPFNLRTVWRPLLVVGAGVAVGASWWIRNIADYGSVQPSGYGPAYLKQYVYGVPQRGTLSHFLPTFLDAFTSRIWAQIGIPDPPSPGPLVIYGWLFLIGTAVVAALVVRSAPGQRRRLAILGLAVAGYVAIPAEGSWSTYRNYAQTARAAQGRYLYGAFLAVVALATVGLFQLLRSGIFQRLVPILLSAAILTNLACWVLILRSWYQPIGQSDAVSDFGDALHGLFRWAPVPEPLTFLLVIIAPLGAAAVALRVAFRDHWASMAL